MRLSRLRAFTGATIGIMLVGVGLVACQSGGQGTQTSKTAVIVMPDDYDSLDPDMSHGSYSNNQFFTFMYDRLVEVDNNNHLVPHLATSWEVTPTGATLHLRNDVICADGSKLTPTIVAADIRREGSPTANSTYVYRTFGSKGGLQSVTADDGASTVTIQLKAPHSNLMLGLSMWWMSIVCPGGLNNPASLQDHTYGTGPFVITKAKRGDSYTLTRRSDYHWGPKGAESFADTAPKTVEIRVVPSESTQANLLISGQANIGFLTGRDIDRVASTKGIFRTDNLDNGGQGLQFNEKAGLPGSDIYFRQAISMAIDTSAYNVAQTFGHGKVYKTLYSPNLPCYNPADGSAAPTYDLNAAKKLLADHGWAPGADGKLAWNGKAVSLRVVGYSGENNGPDYLLDVVQKLGFNATLRKPDINGWTDIVFTSGDWDVDPYGYSSSFPHPALFAGQLAQANIDNAEYRDDVAKALASTPDQACQYWDAGEIALMKRFDTMSLSIPSYAWFGNGYKYSAPNRLLSPTSIH